MDSLLLTPRRSRIVLEVDGRQHYVAADGVADPRRYAEMAAEDRALQLAGYEVYRFGAHELTTDGAHGILQKFFYEPLRPAAMAMS
jgi:very-short-patch-repair endonuclease